MGKDCGRAPHDVVVGSSTREISSSPLVAVSRSGEERFALPEHRAGPWAQMVWWIHFG